MVEELNDNEIEAEEPMVDDTDTGSAEEVETVETFDDKLEEASSDEDFANIANSLREGELEEEETENTEETSEEEEVESEPTTSEFDFNIGTGIKIKDGDLELNIMDKAKVVELLQKGLNYGGKTTELAKHRSFVNYAEENGISLDDIQQLKDIKSGNKDAYSALAKTSGIDVYDVKEEHSYNPEPVQTPQYVDPEVDYVANEILANEEHTQQFKKWVNNDKMPPAVVTQIMSDVNAIRAVQADIQSGIFDKAMHKAYEDVRLNNAEFNSAYIRAKEMLVGTKTPTAPKQEITRGDRQRATPTRGKSSVKKTYGVLDDMNSDEFLENLDDIIAGLERP